MKIDTMRQIDYWLGIPLCFFASIGLWFFEGVFRLWRNTKTTPPQKVLFVELSEMGSAILVDPAMRSMQRQHKAQLYFVIFESNQHSLKLLGTVPSANIYKIRNKNLFTLTMDTLAFFWWTRYNDIDTVIDLELFSRYSGLLTGLSGARRRVGFHAFHNEGLYRGHMLSHRVSYNPHQHITKNFLALTYAAAQDIDQIPYSKIAFTEEDTKLTRLEIQKPSQQRVLESIFKAIEQAEKNYGAMINMAGFKAKLNENLNQKNKAPFILINANGSDLLPHRRWPVAYYQEFIQKISQQWPDVFMLLTGSPSESEYVESLRIGAHTPHCINFAGCVDFTDLPALYDMAQLMLTNDSGAAHFASVTALPTFVLFGPETPSLYGSLGQFIPISAYLSCSPCVSAWNHRKTACKDNVCMQKISVEQVLQTIHPYLS